MKVLLLRDQDKLGKAGDVKNVADGYARNYLLPRGLAVLATPSALKQAETIRKAEEKRRAQLHAEAQAVANQLAGTTLTFRALAGETGKLYGSITAHDIVEAIQREKGIELDKRKVELREPLRSLGTHTVSVRLATDLAPTVTVVVEAAEQAPAAEGAQPVA
jgi:large subunit ribosomal protein L9